MYYNNKIDAMLKGVFRTTVLTIPIITFIIGFGIFNKYLICLAIGMFLSGLVNLAIKYFLKQFNTTIFLRPYNAKGCGVCYGEEYAGNMIGFPSGHSQLIWFFTTYLFIYSYTKYNNLYILPILLLLAISTSISRLGILPFLGSPCHSIIQVLSGSILGIITAYYYFKYILDILR